MGGSEREGVRGGGSGRLAGSTREDRKWGALREGREGGSEREEAVVVQLAVPGRAGGGVL